MTPTVLTQQLQTLKTNYAEVLMEAGAMARTESDLEFIAARLAPYKAQIEILERLLTADYGAIAQKVLKEAITPVKFPTRRGTGPTLKELQAIAKARGLRGFSKLRKAELIAALEDPNVRCWDKKLTLVEIKGRVHRLMPGLPSTKEIKKAAVARGWITADADLRTRAAWESILAAAS